ncbi:MAG: hypothetical protein U0L88_15845 [Acutalibacteraceae bacterium]|nr:hypothetical protein [Acutalibacteraceae bacterium]
MSRVDKVAKNMKIALLCQMLTAVESFVLRSVFVACLDEVYLGLNGLFADILSMLSLAELGFGTSIIFSLYKPVANSDKEKIKSLMRLYRNIYAIVGAFVLIAGLSLAPRLDLFLKEMPDIPHLRLIYAMSVINSAASYFFVYKASLLFADQKKYVELIITTAVKFVGVLVQIVVLLLTHNYIALMAVIIATTLVQNICISASTDKRYPYLKDKNVRPLEKEDKLTLKTNVGAMVFHKFGSVAIFSTDSILMAKLVSVVSVGLYSNYMLIRKAIIMVVEVMFNGITSGMGNLSACEGGERRCEAFENIYFFSAWIFGFASICLAELYNPFITLWLGEHFTFGRGVVLLIVLYFYLYCMRIPVCSAKEAMGLFRQDKYKPIAEVVLNLVISIVLAKKIGIAGVILGTILSTLLVPFWIEPLVVYRWGFKKNVIGFFARFGLYTLVTLAVWQLTAFLCSLTPDGFLGFVIKMAICTAVPNAAFALIYCKTKEFAYLKSIGFSMLKKFIRRA